MGPVDLVGGWGAPDAAVAVVAPGEAGVLASAGDRALRSGWASVTKLATALAVLVAVEEGTLALDDPAGPPGSTVRHLLAHASGLAFDEERVLARPGERRIYSNVGFETLARELADRSGMPFERYLTEAVLEPLGMAETRLEEGGTAAAGLGGPLEDMIRLASELLVPTLVSEETFRCATAEVAFPGLGGVLPGVGRFRPLDWGLGFEIRDGKEPHWTGTGNSPATFGHFGGSGSFLWVDPDARLACAVLSRRGFDSWALRAWPELSDAVLADYAGG
ncbi:MAG: serine hydrolase domain-containing protein [Acidimicrobiia bacterium]